MKEGDKIRCKKDFCCNISPFKCKKGSIVILIRIYKDVTIGYQIVYNGRSTWVIVKRSNATTPGYLDYDEFFEIRSERIRRIAKSFIAE